MCDALSRNVPPQFKTILSNCLSHARRRFVDVTTRFPDECRHVLETLRDVYANDALARDQQMSPAERLRFHQRHSGPLLGLLKKWLKQQLRHKRAEPNSGLGEAIEYMLEHWKKLTLFLRVASAALDNYICERAIKKTILTRSAAGKPTFHIFGALAQFEAELVRERTRAGLAAARSRGAKPGRPRRLDPDQIEVARTLLASPKLSARQVAAQLGVHWATLYRALARAS